jgi:hypothetical protein
MALVRAGEIYRRAREGRYAIGGFCAENLEIIQAIVGAAEDTRSPLVLMLWQEDILAVGPGYLEQIGRYAAERSTVPVALMVDHASSLAFCLRCMLICALPAPCGWLFSTWWSENGRPWDAPIPTRDGSMGRRGMLYGR